MQSPYSMRALLSSIMATHKPVTIDELFGKLEQIQTELWYVIHTKPRQEKKLAGFCQTEGMWYYLPQMPREHLYNHRKVLFDVPMFPGYIFTSLDEDKRERIKYSGAIVNIIKVKNQKALLSELNSILLSKQKHLDFEAAVWLDKGLEVMVIKGPLKGIRGVVESHTKLEEVQLQIDILRQAVRVKVRADQLRILGDYKIVESEV